MGGLQLFVDGDNLGVGAVFEEPEAEEVADFLVQGWFLFLGEDEAVAAVQAAQFVGEGKIGLGLCRASVPERH